MPMHCSGRHPVTQSVLDSRCPGGHSPVSMSGSSKSAVTGTSGTSQALAASSILYKSTVSGHSETSQPAVSAKKNTIVS